jgi:uncharacterized protein YjgD (DUF1641 family)
MEGNNDSSNEKHTRTHSLSLNTAQRYSQPIPAQTTNKTSQPEGGAARSQRTMCQPRSQTLSNPTASFLESAVAKVGKVVHTVTHTSPTKIRSTLTGNKKRTQESERATTPTPLNYTNEGLITGGPRGPGHFDPWDEDMNFTGIEDEEVTDQSSIQTDTSSNLAHQLTNKEEKLNNLYDSLLKARNFVQALTAGGGIKDAQESQHITRCMTGLANALLNQPYRVLIDQQAELLQAIQQINSSVATLIEKVDNNEKKKPAYQLLKGKPPFQDTEPRGHTPRKSQQHICNRTHLQAQR